MNNSVHTSTRTVPRFSLLGRVFRGALQMAVLGAAGGALFGAVFGVLATLLPGLPWSIIGLAGHFAIAGCSAGFIIGWCGPWFESESVLDSDDPVQAGSLELPDTIQLQQSTAPKAAGNSLVPSNRVGVFMNTDAKRKPGAAVPDPIRN